MRISLFTRCLLLGLMMLAIPVGSSAGIIFSVEIAPPPLPIYEQPICPGEGYIWVPGYWAYGDDGYFWVPGTWVLAPEPGFLWTPGYWGWGDGVFIFNQGYWALQVDSMAVSITASATPVWAIRADIGTTESSSITDP
jgi:WXXGXW repeat (2 copies)